MKKLVKKQTGGPAKKTTAKPSEKSWMETGVLKDTHLKHNYDLMKNATKSVAKSIKSGVNKVGESLKSDIENFGYTGKQSPFYKKKGGSVPSKMKLGGATKTKSKK